MPTNGYDDQNRLTAWNRTDGLRNQTWTLSAVNDWISFTDAGTTTARTHGPTHEVLTVGAAAITHDSRGNMTTDEFAISRTYDWNNKVSQAVVPTGSVRGIVGTHDYQYDALGRRVRKTIGGSSPSDTVFVHVGEQIYADYTAGAAATSPDKKYVWGSYVDELVCQINGTTKYYIHRNQQYSTTAITAQSGTPAERYGYTSYGDLRVLNPNTLGIRTTPPMTRYTYTGREYDHECGTYHFRARSYSASLGRFTRHDPILYPDGYNTYAGWFAAKAVDPRGKDLGMIDWGLGDYWVLEAQSRLDQYNRIMNGVFGRMRNVNPCLKKATGLDGFTNLLANAGVTSVGISDPACAEGTCIYVPPGSLERGGGGGMIDSDDTTMVHETIHVIDYRNGWNLGWLGADDISAAEGLVYGAIAILDQNDIFDRAIKSGSPNCSTLKRDTNPKFEVEWARIGSRIIGNGTRPGNATDLANVANRLGLKLDCAKIAKCLNCKGCPCD